MLEQTRGAGQLAGDLPEVLEAGVHDWRPTCWRLGGRPGTAASLRGGTPEGISIWMVRISISRPGGPSKRTLPVGFASSASPHSGRPQGSRRRAACAELTPASWMRP